MTVELLIETFTLKILILNWKKRRSKKRVEMEMKKKRKLNLQVSEKLQIILKTFEVHGGVWAFFWFEGEWQKKTVLYIERC
jgi:hypothetical protein